MKRLHQGNINRAWYCSLCDSFQGLTLWILLTHNTVHGNEPNFRVLCQVDGCPAMFTRYNSFYKHILRYHKDVYNNHLPHANDSDSHRDSDDHDQDDCNRQLDGDHDNHDDDGDDGNESDSHYNNNEETDEDTNTSSDSDGIQESMDQEKVE